MSKLVVEDGKTFAISETGGKKEIKLGRFDLVPVEPLTELAEHYGRGATKYADHNWSNGYDWGHSYASLMRHLTAFWGGEDIDPESGSKHIIAVAWHALTLSYFMDHHPDYDNRHSTLLARAAAAPPMFDTTVEEMSTESRSAAEEQPPF